MIHLSTEFVKSVEFHVSSVPRVNCPPFTLPPFLSRLEDGEHNSASEWLSAHTAHVRSAAALLSAKTAAGLCLLAVLGAVRCGSGPNLPSAIATRESALDGFLGRLESAAANAELFRRLRGHVQFSL
jgi:hypothetical protein